MRIYMSVFIVMLSFIVACSTIDYNTIVYTTAKNEVILNDTWKSFIRKNKSPKIVLRVPGYAKGVTQQEMSTNDLFYNYIEKKLLMSNFVVRDRALLTTVLSKLGENYSDYEIIGKKVNTDIILEIISYQKNCNIPGTSYHVTQILDEKGKKIDENKSPEGKTSFCGALLEGRLILVSRGEVVGMFTIKEIVKETHKNCKEVGQSGCLNEFPIIECESVITDSDNEYLNNQISEKLIKLMREGKVEDSTASN